MNPDVTTYHKKIGSHERIEEIRRACGEVWTQTKWARDWLYFEHDYHLSRGDAMALFATGRFTSKVSEAIGRLPFEVDLHGPPKNPFMTGLMRKAPSQQRQSAIDRLYDNYETYFSNYANNPDHNPPGPKRFYNALWGWNKVKKEDGRLILSTGRREPSIQLEWPHPCPRTIDFGYDSGLVAHCVYDRSRQDLPAGMIRDREPRGEKVAGVDLGEKVLAAYYDGEQSLLVDGGELRRLRRVQNSEKEWFAKRIDRKQKGSTRWKKLVEAKSTRLREIRNKVEDLLHKLSTRLVEEAWGRGVGTLVIGDLSGLREGMDYGSDMNRRLHQWAFRQFATKVEYKAERYGITVTFEPERDTTKRCPQCGEKNTPNDRQYRCASCGFEGHRDVNGAANIRAKHKDPDGWQSGHLAAVRATATGADSSRAPEGTPTDGQLSLFEQGRPGEKRATLHSGLPQRVEYHPHMDCVFNPDRVAEG